MKKNAALIIALLCTLSIKSEVKFTDYFTNEVLRIDFILSGNKSHQYAALDQIYAEKEWGGRKTNLDRFHGKGTYKFDIMDLKTGKLIYTDGFSTLFQEWQTTGEAEVLDRSFENTVYSPMPKNKVSFVLVHRVKGLFTDTLINVNLDVNGDLLRPTEQPDAVVKEILMQGDADACVDIVVIGDGFTSDDEVLFFEDAKKFAEGMFTSEPFAKNRSRFNIRAVMPFSKEEGADIPQEGIFVQTALDASYYTLYSDRYLMTSSLFRLADYASLVPHDQIIILVNSEKYGGGGIFNFYSVSSARGRSNLQVFIHEFGHSFAGLGDEYYTSDVSYNDFYPKNIEPWEPNLTTLVDFDGKWKDMLAEGTPVPTPAKGKYLNTVGVFEGGGYVAKGVYRPAYDCRMKTNEADDFCPVCKHAVVRTIEFYATPE